MSSEALLTWRCDKQSRAQERGTRSLESPSSHPHVECAATSGQAISHEDSGFWDSSFSKIVHHLFAVQRKEPTFGVNLPL